MTSASRNNTPRRRAIAWLASKVKRNKNHMNHLSLNCVRRRGRFRFGPDRGGARVRAVVVTVTVAEIGLVPLGVTLDGEIEQVAFGIDPVQLRLTLALNPKEGVTVMV